MRLLFVLKEVPKVLIAKTFIYEFKKWMSDKTKMV